MHPRTVLATVGLELPLSAWPAGGGLTCCSALLVATPGPWPGWACMSIHPLLSRPRPTSSSSSSTVHERMVLAEGELRKGDCSSEPRIPGLGLRACRISRASAAQLLSGCRGRRPRGNGVQVSSRSNKFAWVAVRAGRVASNAAANGRDRPFKVQRRAEATNGLPELHLLQQDRTRGKHVSVPTPLALVGIHNCCIPLRSSHRPLALMIMRCTPRLVPAAPPSPPSPHPPRQLIWLCLHNM
jgi:hypothetical protein